MTAPLSSGTTARFDELVTRACERAGLDDFGEDSWQQGLRLLIETCESAPGVNPGGRDFVYGQFVDALWNRLRVIDYVKQHPEVADERVDRPAGGARAPAHGHLAGELSARSRSAPSVVADVGGRGLRAAVHTGNVA